MKVAIIDYGSGNLRSAAKAFERAARDGARGVAIEVTGDAAALKNASHIVLPGVGAFADCRAGLKRLPGLWEALDEAVRREGKPFLGICVGMQLMARVGREHGMHQGFGWIDGEVVRLEPDDASLKVPHMGWNDLEIAAPNHPVLRGIASGEHAYFVHSYHLALTAGSATLANVDYGGSVTAIVGRDNMVGTQFHPEKSQALGLKLIANFLAWQA
ncbi:MAG: imidazole glycerol phosphate synthase subunit HisH [Alphaproteobacteria bacterium]|nr:imidazole glycerol phosphate synthase subunit HisH [Alphaproteobacteria bacterium]